MCLYNNIFSPPKIAITSIYAAQNIIELNYKKSL